jgi:hypothetical protein
VAAENLLATTIVKRCHPERSEGPAVGNEMSYVNVEYSDALNYIFSAKSTMERLATPVGPIASHGRPSSTQHGTKKRCHPERSEGPAVRFFGRA